MALSLGWQPGNQHCWRCEPQSEGRSPVSQLSFAGRRNKSHCCRRGSGPPWTVWDRPTQSADSDADLGRTRSHRRTWKGEISGHPQDPLQPTQGSLGILGSPSPAGDTGWSRPHAWDVWPVPGAAPPSLSSGPRWLYRLAFPSRPLCTLGRMTSKVIPRVLSVRRPHSPRSHTHLNGGCVLSRAACQTKNWLSLHAGLSRVTVAFSCASPCRWAQAFDRHGGAKGPLRL